MDSTDLEREKGITILAKNTAVHYGDLDRQHRRHARARRLRRRGRARPDDGRRRAAPRRRHRRARCPRPASCCASRSRPTCRCVVVINKVDRPDARPAEVLDAVYELFIDLGATEHQIEFPVIYCNARTGQAALTPDEVPDAPGPQGRSSSCWWSTSRRRRTTEGHPFQAQVANLDASPYVGRLAICRVHQGWVRKGQTVAWCRADGAMQTGAHRRALPDRGPPARRRRPRGAGPGDIIAVAGIPEIMIGDTLADPDDPRPLPRMTVDEPAISMTIGINTSPLAGREGQQAHRPPGQGPPRRRARRQRVACGCCPPTAPTPGRSRAAASSRWPSWWS